ncbi:hypothetical protein NE237_002116 [Protea cynaroides]|uniref:Major facilitator superfamily (MFS) profile domain-containing protein n=1 Tax=Protea cynaroides TaxID=273540 RepID=A0A9Q0QZ50_9MAGN|nr:hypothetical protein NE237_002116 [Protea cynaroides]
MGLVGLQENGNGDEFSNFPLRTQKKYKRVGANNTKLYVFVFAVFASLNSVLLGYDAGVMSGAILFIQEDLKKTEVQEEVLVGCLSIVSLVGSLAGGRTSDAIGRKWTMALAAIVFQTGAAIMAFAPDFQALLIESPRWLAIQNRIEEARLVLLKTVESEREVDQRIQEIQQAARTAKADKSEEKPVWHELLIPSPPVRCMLVTGIGIQCLQQLTVCWVVASEIFPLRLRAQASAIGAVGNRVSNGLVTMSFLSISDAITVAGTFFIFSFIAAICVVFVYVFVPETKGKSLEQIELLYKNIGGWQGGEVEPGAVEHVTNHGITYQLVTYIHCRGRDHLTMSSKRSSICVPREGYYNGLF